MNPQRSVAAFEMEAVARGLLLRERGTFSTMAFSSFCGPGCPNAAEPSRSARTIRVCFNNRWLMYHRPRQDGYSTGQDDSSRQPPAGYQSCSHDYKRHRRLGEVVATAPGRPSEIERRQPREQPDESSRPGCPPLGGRLSPYCEPPSLFIMSPLSVACRPR